MGIPFNLQLGINLIDILLDAPLGKEQLFRNFPIPQAARHQLHDFIFPFRQRGKGCRAMRGKLLLPLCSDAFPSRWMRARRGVCGSFSSVFLI